jgi:hypothetical protein
MAKNLITPPFTPARMREFAAVFALTFDFLLFSVVASVMLYKSFSHIRALDRQIAYSRTRRRSSRIVLR